MDGLSAGRAAVGWSVLHNLIRGPILVPTPILARIVALALDPILAPVLVRILGRFPDRIATDIGTCRGLSQSLKMVVEWAGLGRMSHRPYEGSSA